MKIRDHLPFRQASSDIAVAVDDALPEMTAPSPPQPQERPNAQEQTASANGVAAAFETLAQAVGAEFDSVKAVVAALESNLMKRMEENLHEVEAKIDARRTELLDRTEKLRHEQQKAMAEVVDKNKEAMTGLSASVQRTREQLDQQSQELRRDVERLLLEKEKKHGAEMEALSTRLAAVKSGLDGQIRTSKVVTSLLGHISKLFAAQPKLGLENEASEGPTEPPPAKPAG